MADDDLRKRCWSGHQSAYDNFYTHTFDGLVVFHHVHLLQLRNSYSEDIEYFQATLAYVLLQSISDRQSHLEFLALFALSRSKSKKEDSTVSEIYWLSFC